MVKAIDIVCNLFTPVEFEEGSLGFDERFMEQINMPADMRGGVTIERYIEKMDAAGVERSLLLACRAGDPRMKWSAHIPYERVAEICAKYPDRFSGVAGIEPNMGMQGVRDLEHAVKEYGFVGAHWYPHWSRIAPDAAQVYPYYAKCCELDVPVMMQVGQNLVYQSDIRLPSVARPITLDQVAIDFPELKLIGIHIGVPWTGEMIAMAWKHPNIYIGVDAYAPKYWPEELWHYLNTYGKHKVLFGTDWPVIDPERGIREINEHGVRPEAYPLLMRENALKLFKLPG
ncbi:MULTISPECIES: amidohydrolase family protein [unclassified Novosphingobium]|uniref:amidohydrolase family protein n=1 Tax=unclassified Novosphingobium TaxID=2644732 RepID=UPI00061C1D0E|nr:MULTISPECIES: amidohydrolase family protein [unclassified Novosphingobium]GAO56580.1 hypothetical protein NMD1_03747 [Novosphingobium sp. MD-1]